MAKSIQIAFAEDQLTALGRYYREELKNAEKQVAGIKAILAKIEGTTPKNKPGRKPAIEKMAKALTGKKRGPKPGSKKAKPVAAKKRGRKQNAEMPAAEQ